MSKQFNPYHAWLGIPPEEQPPNHYRLLGIPLFESNEDVIQNGLDQRMIHVKSFATGPHAAESQRLLTELSQAGVCLLRPEKKLAYDQQLRSRLHATAATAEMGPGLAPLSVSPQAAGVPPRSPILTRRSASPGLAARTAGTADIPAQAKPDRSVHSGFPLVSTIAGAVIGLSLAFLALHMFSPVRKPPEMAAQNDLMEKASERVAKLSNEAGGDDTPEAESLSATGQGKETTPGSPLQRASGTHPERTAPPTESQPQSASPAPLSKSPESQPTNPMETAGSQPSSRWPSPLPGSPAATPVSPPSQPADPFSTTVNPATPSGITPRNSTAGTMPRAPFAGTAKSIILDLERSSMYVTLAENAEGQKVRAQVRSITKFTPSYDLEPDDGIISLRQPVDVVLTEYAGVKIRLTLRMRGKNADLEIAPEIETGQGKTSDFSKRTLDLFNRSTKKDALALNKQLAAAQGEALEIQNWLTSPVTKTIPVRNARTQRLGVLMSQVIPSLQQQLADTQVRMDLVQQLSVLVGQIHEKASLDLAVQVEPADKVE